MSPSQFPGNTLQPIPGITGGESEYTILQKICQNLYGISQAGGGGGGGSGITALTGDGTATGPGSAALTVTKSGGVAFGSGAFAAAISPGGSSGQVQYNNGGTALGGMTGMTLTAGALTGISFTGITKCTTFTADGGGSADILNTVNAGQEGMRMFGAFDGVNFVVKITDGNNNNMMSWGVGAYTIFPPVVALSGLALTAATIIPNNWFNLTIGSTVVKVPCMV